MRLHRLHWVIDSWVKKLRHAQIIEWQIENIVEDKDAENKKRSMKATRQMFQEYLKEKKTIIDSKEEGNYRMRFESILRYGILHCCLTFFMETSMYNITINKF